MFSTTETQKHYYLFFYYYLCNHVQKFDILNYWKTLTTIFPPKNVWKGHTLANRQNIWKENTEKCYAVSSIAIFLLNSLVSKEKSSLFWKVDKRDYDDFSNFLPDLSENCFLWKEVTMALARFFFKSTWYIKVTFVLLSVWKLFFSLFWYNQLWKKSWQIEYWC